MVSPTFGITSAKAPATTAKYESKFFISYFYFKTANTLWLATGMKPSQIAKQTDTPQLALWVVYNNAQAMVSAITIIPTIYFKCNFSFNKNLSKTKTIKGEVTRIIVVRVTPI